MQSKSKIQTKLQVEHKQKARVINQKFSSTQNSTITIYDSQPSSSLMISDSQFPDSQLFEPIKPTQTSAPKVDKPKRVYKKSSIIKSNTAIEESFQIEERQCSSKLSQPLSIISSAQSTKNKAKSEIALTSTQLADINNNTIFSLTQPSQQEANRSEIQNSNNDFIVRIRQPSEYMHASQLPNNFWSNLICHRFWYADMDVWD